MAKEFYYADATTSSTGIMVCAACHKPITEGQYRYRETDDKFINHHRGCSLDDLKWAEMDRDSEDHETRLSEYRKDIEVMRLKWGHWFEEDLCDCVNDQ